MIDFRLNRSTRSIYDSASYDDFKFKRIKMKTITRMLNEPSSFLNIILGKIIDPNPSYFICFDYVFLFFL